MKNFEKYKTAEERAKAFEEWCNIRGGCGNCVLLDEGAEYASLVCAIHWLDLEAEDEQILPCPFCGKKVREFYNYDHTGKKLMCTCGYNSPWVDKDEEHSSHNRVARCAMKDEEGDK